MAAEEFDVELQGGAPWGIRLQGGAEFRAPLRIAAVTPNGKAASSGLLVGDYLEKINGTSCATMRHSEAQKLVKLTGRHLKLAIRRGSPSQIATTTTTTKTTTKTTKTTMTVAAAAAAVAAPKEATPPSPALPSPPPPLSPTSLGDLPSPPPPPAAGDDVIDLPPPDEDAWVSTSPDLPPPEDAWVSIATSPDAWVTVSTTTETAPAPVSAKKFDFPAPPPGRGPRRLTSGSDVTTTPPAPVGVEPEAVQMRPERTSKDEKPSRNSGKTPSWYKDMFRSIHTVSDFSGQATSAENSAKESLPSSSQTPPERKSSSPAPSSQKPAPSRNVVSAGPKSPSYRSPGTVTVSGFSDPDAVLRQHSGSSKSARSSASPAPAPSPGRLSGTAGSIYKMFQSGGEIPTGGLANLPRKTSPKEKRKSYEVKSRTPTPPPPPSDVAADPEPRRRKSSASMAVRSKEGPSVYAMIQDIKSKSASPPPPSQPSVAVATAIKTRSTSQSSAESAPSFKQKSRSTSKSSSTSSSSPPPPVYSSRVSVKSPSPSPSGELHTSTLIVKVSANDGGRPVPVASAAGVATTSPAKSSPAPPTRKTMSPSPGPVSPVVPGKGQARAKFRFKAESPKELDFQKGAIVTLNRQIDENWFEGELDGRKGIFPVRYVEVLVALPEEAMPKKRTSMQPLSPVVTEPTARAKYKFQGQTAKELSFKKNDLIGLIRRVDDNWYEGKLGSAQGIFPVAYVEVLMDVKEFERKLSATATRKKSASSDDGFGKERKTSVKKAGPARPAQPPSRTPAVLQEKHRGKKYVAQFSYSPENKDELDLLEDDVIYVVEKCEDGWFVGTSERSGKFGTFPGNYVEAFADS